MLERLASARALVEQLEESKTSLQERMRAESRADAMETATGRSSLDAAIETAKGIVKRLEGIAGPYAEVKSMPSNDRARA